MIEYNIDNIFVVFNGGIIWSIVYCENWKIKVIIFFCLCTQFNNEEKCNIANECHNSGCLYEDKIQFSYISWAGKVAFLHSCNSLLDCLKETFSIRDPIGYVSFNPMDKRFKKCTFVTSCKLLCLKSTCVEQ